MMKAFLFLVLAALAAGAASAEVDCQQLYREHLESDLTLSYEAFDQTMGSGFRELSAQGCEREAADLIEAYIEATGAEQNSLRWHIAQLRASHGDYEQAVRYARSSLIENEDLSARPLRWNDYVLATIAFLEEDREALQRHRDRVAEGVDEHRGNAMNLRLLDALIEHFEASYAEALRSLAPDSGS